VNVASVAATKVHAILSLKEVTFSGNHKIDQDTHGEFQPPEWLAGRAKQWPVCYTRTKKVKLKAKFEVMAPPTATETVKIKGVAKLGTATLEWTTSVSVAPSAKEVTTPELTSSAALPNHVACYDLAQIQWEAEPAGDHVYLAGASENVMYVTLGDPSGTPAYWTLLDISCRAAHGATSAAKLIQEAFEPFTGRALTRKYDGRGLTYWVPGNTRATNTALLLARGDGGGQCGSWAHFLIDMYQCHGESAMKVMVVVTLQHHLNETAGFLVKNWSFKGKGSYPPPMSHEMGTECVSLPGVAGQRNPDPPPAFYNHFIVVALAKIYDPSYGSAPVSKTLDWENASIDGLYAGSRCGYQKSAYSARQLLQFHQR
jgi:hypothetical protein